MSDPARESLDLVAVNTFYTRLLEARLGHPIPAPQQIASADVAPDALRRWLDLLDMAISPPMVRDALKDVETHVTAEALLRYFIAKRSRVVGDREKTDFVATFLYRYFSPGPPSSPEPDLPRRRSEENEILIEQEAGPLPFETEIFRILGDCAVPPLPEEHRQLVREFHYIAQEVDDFRHFDHLMDSGVMQRVRDIKLAFGESFYHPQVLATLAEYNVFFGSRFDDLFHLAARQIKSFAAHIQQEGGSIMSRLDGDLIVKHLAEVEENAILQTEYGRAQESFRKISKMKKAVDQRGGARSPAQMASRAAAAAAAPQIATPLASASDLVHGGKNVVEEGKIKGMEDFIRNFVRAADPRAARVVPLRHGSIDLNQAEVEAFRANYGDERSFRAEYAACLRLTLTLRAHMGAELADYRAKRESAYLWKPHADSLAYLLGATKRAVETCGPILAIAQQRGLNDKIEILNASLQKLRNETQSIAKALETMA